MTDTTMFHSAIDAQLGVPGEQRAALAQQLAHAHAHDDADPWTSTSWQQIVELDARDGLGSRPAVRAVLRRPSDGRFLIFRYPFRDGSVRFVIPGGGAEPGEDAQTTVRREVHEETGAQAHDLTATGLVLYHVLASTIYGADRTPVIQYSPVFTGMIDDELPDTQHREAHWFSIDEFAQQPRRPISDPILAILRASEAGDPITSQAVWLPA